MMEKLKTYSFIILVSLLLVFMNRMLASDFLINFLKKDLVTILIALLAINTATISVIMTKLKEITDNNKIDFTMTIHELKESVFEQVIYIVLAIIVMVLLGSKVVLTLFQYSETALEILLVSIFVAALYNLYDTATSVFVILRHENNH